MENSWELTIKHGEKWGIEASDWLCDQWYTRHIIWILYYIITLLYYIITLLYFIVLYNYYIMLYYAILYCII